MPESNAVKVIETFTNYLPVTLTPAQQLEIMQRYPQVR